jgi:hypothetical protein
MEDAKLAAVHQVHSFTVLLPVETPTPMCWCGEPVWNRTCTTSLPDFTPSDHQTFRPPNIMVVVRYSLESYCRSTPLWISALLTLLWAHGCECSQQCDGSCRREKPF